MPAVRSLTRLAVLAASLLVGCAAPPQQETRADPLETARAHALFDSMWDQSLRLNPEFATALGDHRFGDRFSDASPAGIAAQDAWWRSLQQQALALDVAKLSPTDRVSAELLRHRADDQVAEAQFDGFRTMTFGGGPRSFPAMFAGLLRSSPVATIQQVEQMLARMAAYPRRVDQEIVRLRMGAASGWVSARPGLQRALEQLDAQLATAVEQGPFFEPFKRLGSGIAPAEQQALRERASRAIEQQVLPATRRLRDFVAREYLPAAPADGALLRYPGGDHVYAAQVRRHTTTALAPRQIHDLGQRQLARLRTEMEAVMRGTGFDGDFASFVRFISTDPKFFHASGDALLAGYRDIAKRIDPELPRLFAELPRASYGIRAMPEFLGPDAAPNYSGPALDGSRPGWFNANVLAYKNRPKWSMETLVAHEAVPGHHLQSARAVELSGLPAFRRASFYTVYGEGWALYAETLGSELGLYRDPYSRFGHLQWQAFRAARLVVDTGIHALGWSRQQAIDFMVERTGVDRDFVTSEIDRYTTWPGQALAYMVGQLKLVELRDRAKAALNERFDIRRFHMVVLDTGQVPLDILERLVDAWIAAEAAAAKR